MCPGSPCLPESGEGLGGSLSSQLSQSQKGCRASSGEGPNYGSDHGLVRFPAAARRYCPASTLGAGAAETSQERGCGTGAEGPGRAEARATRR